MYLISYKINFNLRALSKMTEEGLLTDIIHFQTDQILHIMDGYRVQFEVASEIKVYISIIK